MFIHKHTNTHKCIPKRTHVNNQIKIGTDTSYTEGYRKTSGEKKLSTKLKSINRNKLISPQKIFFFSIMEKFLFS